MNKQEAKEVLELLENIKSLTEVNKIITTFIPAFRTKCLIHSSNPHTKDSVCLHGSFNLGSVKSGRLSSSNPNLQQIPSTGTIYAKPIKKCFSAPEGWLMVGADYSSLEDRISALQTKDPNKLKVYIEGYDGHSLRAYAYFKDQMPDIEPTKESINSIGSKYPHLRQLSKAPTFALTYQGTWRTLVQNCGFDEETARKIEAEYHRLYEHSDNWVQEKLSEAAAQGYAELAFGLRLRVPLMEKTLWESDGKPYEAIKESKTAGNALTQSYGLLNTRAANEFMERVWDSEKWKTKVLPIAQIHDALYFIVENNLDCVHWVNKNLIECMTNFTLPEIEHPIVKLEAQLEIYYPDWSVGIPIPNNATQDEIREATYSV